MVPIPGPHDAERPGEPERIDRILEALAAFHAFHAPRLQARNDWRRTLARRLTISRRRRDAARFRQRTLF